MKLKWLNLCKFRWNLPKKWINFVFYLNRPERYLLLPLYMHDRMEDSRCSLHPSYMAWIVGCRWWWSYFLQYSTNLKQMCVGRKSSNNNLKCNQIYLMRNFYVIIYFRDLFPSVLFVCCRNAWRLNRQYLKQPSSRLFSQLRHHCVRTRVF